MGHNIPPVPILRYSPNPVPILRYSPKPVPAVYMVVPVKNGQVCPKLVELFSKVTAESLVMVLQHTVIETLDQICIHAMNKISWRFVNQRSLQNLA